MISIFFHVMLPVLFTLSAGWLMGMKFDLHHKSLSSLSIYLFTPALIFHSLSRYSQLFQIKNLKIFLIIFAVTLLIFFAVEIIARLFSFSRHFKSIVLLTLVLSNTGNWGLPINQNAYGSKGFPIAVIILVIMAIYSNTLGVVLSASDKQNLKESLQTLFRLPLFYALLLGLGFNFFRLALPLPLASAVKNIANIAVPFNLLLLGIYLSKIQLSKNLVPVFLLSSVKLLFIPLLTFAVAKLFALKSTALQVTVTQLGMPAAVYSVILSGHFDHREHAFAGQVVLISTLLSVFTLTVIIWILQNYF